MLLIQRPVCRLDRHFAERADIHLSRSPLQRHGAEASLHGWPPFSRSWPGLARPPTRSNQLVVQIIPIRIIEQDQPHLPGASVMFDVLLALPCVANVLVALEVHQALQPVLFGETLDKTLAVLPGSSRKIVCDPDVEDAVR